MNKPESPPPSSTHCTAAVTHSRIDPDIYDALMHATGWSAPIELLDGEPVVMLPSGGWASYARSAVVAQLHAWQRHIGDEGLVLPRTFVRFGDQTVAPDACYWTASRRPEVVRGRIDGPSPGLVVEVLSLESAANATGPKRSLYLASDVREYWIVDPGARRVTVATPPADEADLTVVDQLVSDVLVGFRIDVGQLFPAP